MAHNTLHLTGFHQVRRRVTESPCMSLMSQYHLSSWTITSNHQNLPLISRLDLPMLEKQEIDPSLQNHTILHSFLSGIIQEFLVKNLYVRPPLQVQPLHESARSPRKRRKLADHTVSIYSPGQSQPLYRTAELDYHPSAQHVQSHCSECSGSCDECGSCCDEYFPPDDTNYTHDHLKPEEYSLGGEGLEAQVTFNHCFPRGC